MAWVQGCALRCPGCVVPESHARDSGAPLMTPEALVARLLDGPPVSGVTFSGGEPLLQARGLASAVRLMRAKRPDWTFMSYSGYRLGVLLSRGTADQIALLEQLDLLVDGPFNRRLAAPLRWRGSANQRVLALTARGAASLRGLDDSPDGVEISIDTRGQLTWTGVPPDGFRQALDDAIARAGLIAAHHAHPAAHSPTSVSNDHDRRHA